MLYVCWNTSNLIEINYLLTKFSSFLFHPTSSFSLAVYIHYLYFICTYHYVFVFCVYIEYSLCLIYTYFMLSIFPCYLNVQINKRKRINNLQALLFLKNGDGNNGKHKQQYQDNNDNSVCLKTSFPSTDNSSSTASISYSCQIYSWRENSSDTTL